MNIYIIFIMVQGASILLDDRFKDLLDISHPAIIREDVVPGELEKVMEDKLEPIITGDTDDRFYLNVFPSGNVYVVLRVERDISEAEAMRYFGEKLEQSYGDEVEDGKLVRSPICNEEVNSALGDSRCSIQYMMKFDDGVVQIAGLGRRWGTQPNTCTAIYGHIVSGRNP